MRRVFDREAFCVALQHRTDSVRDLMRFPRVVTLRTVANLQVVDAYLVSAALDNVGASQPPPSLIDRHDPPVVIEQGDMCGQCI